MPVSDKSTRFRHHFRPGDEAAQPPWFKSAGEISETPARAAQAFLASLGGEMPSYLGHGLSWRSRGVVAKVAKECHRRTRKQANRGDFPSRQGQVHVSTSRTRRSLCGPLLLLCSLAAVVGLWLLPTVALAFVPTQKQPPQAATAEALQAAVSNVCREQLARELEVGHRLSTDCEDDRNRVTRTLVRKLRQKPVFGVVEQRDAAVDNISLILTVARNCRRWMLRSRKSDVLRTADAEAAQCRLQRFSGALEVHGITRDGHRVDGLLQIEVPENGRVVLTYAELEQTLVGSGFLGIDAFSRFELGAEGWAGTIDAEALRRALREAHLSWVLAGRGVPALFAIRHPDHPRASTVRALANASTLFREERDYHAVLTGVLPPERFLDRYLASPYRLAVESLLAPARQHEVAGSH